MKKLVLFGAGGSGREVANIVEKINAVAPTYELLGFVDDDEKLWSSELNGYKVLGGTDWLVQHKEEVYCSVTTGLMKQRISICEKLIGNGVKFETLIDPSASIGRTVEIGEGCIIAEHCELPVNIKVGNYVFLNSDTCLGHDDVIEDYVICNPHVVISGGCTIGKAVVIGGMSFIVQMVKVGDNAVIAPGSVVYGRVRSGVHVMGNPAKKIDL